MMISLPLLYWTISPSKSNQPACAAVKSYFPALALSHDKFPSYDSVLQSCITAQTVLSSLTHFVYAAA